MRRRTPKRRTRKPRTSALRLAQPTPRPSVKRPGTRREPRDPATATGSTTTALTGGGWFACNLAVNLAQL